jgi:3-hydroxyisobutyrate dehydrogenase
MAIGFIGLGNLGKAIANRLIAEGEELLVWNRSKNKINGIKARTADSPKQVIDEVQVSFLCLSDSHAVKSVLESDSGILKGDLSGKIIIDITTNHFDSVFSFYRRIQEKGGSYLEAPVLGSVIPATSGSLAVLVSGDKKSFDSVKRLLDKIGKKIFYLEKPSLATKMKLVNNFVLGSFMSTLGEALVLGEDIVGQKEMVLDILGSGAGNSSILSGKREKLLSGDFSPHFSMAMIHKDLQYLEDLAKSQNRPLFNAMVARELFAKSGPAGMENLDFSAIYTILREL